MRCHPPYHNLYILFWRIMHRSVWGCFSPSCTWLSPLLGLICLKFLQWFRPSSLRCETVIHHSHTTLIRCSIQPVGSSVRRQTWGSGCCLLLHEEVSSTFNHIMCRGSYSACFVYVSVVVCVSCMWRIWLCMRPVAGNHLGGSHSKSI